MLPKGDDLFFCYCDQRELPHTPLGLTPTPREPWVLPYPPRCSQTREAQQRDLRDQTTSGVMELGLNPKFKLPARTWLPPRHSR